MDKGNPIHFLHSILDQEWASIDGGTLFVTALILACVVREIYIWGFHLRDVPCPFWNTFSCNWTLFRRGFDGTLYDWEKELNDKHGRIVRIGPNHVLTDDPDILKRVASPRSAYTKSDWFAISTRFLAGVDSTLTTGRYGQKSIHTSRRSLLASTYGGRDNNSPSIEDILDTQIAELIHLIDTKYAYTSPGPYRPCPFDVIGQYFTLDFTAATLWSEPFGFLKKETDIGNFFQTLERFLPTRAAIGSLSFLPLINPLLERFLAPSPKDKTGLGRLEAIAKEKADARVDEINSGSKDVKNDILTAFINKGLGGDDLYAELFTAVIAGSESPGAMLRIALSLLLVTPTAYARLNAEIAAASLSSPVTDAEARALPYLQAVLRETIRLYPVPAEMYKEVPPGGDTVGGYFLPGGTWIGHNFRGMMRRRDIWGEDADIFRPERWLETGKEGEGERLKRLSGIVDQGFGTGRFSCLGKAVGMMILAKTVVELLRHFDFAAVNPERPITIGVYNLYLVNDQSLLVTRKEKAVGKGE